VDSTCSDFTGNYPPLNFFFGVHVHRFEFITFTKLNICTHTCVGVFSPCWEIESLNCLDVSDKNKCIFIANGNNKRVCLLI